MALRDRIAELLSLPENGVGAPSIDTIESTLTDGYAAAALTLARALEHLLAVVREARRPSRKALREEFIFRDDFRRWLRSTKQPLPAFWFSRSDSAV